MCSYLTYTKGIKMLKYLFSSIILIFSSIMSTKVHTQDNLIQVSQDFLKALKNQDSTEDCKKILKEVSLDELASQINTDEKRKAFWINIYNAFIMDILKDKPELYEDRGAFFKAEQINIAGHITSFDIIEHGIIRRSVNKLSLGFLPKFKVSTFEKKLRSSSRDGRVHFALNCGAKSCPKVAIYSDDKIEEQLDAISKQFLSNTTTYDQENNKALVTTLISWFRGDFGGIKGAKKLLVKYGIVDNKKVNLEFDSYDWTLFLFNFTEI